jgi:NCS1 family nucleobase:cation symporter-1
MVVDYFLVRDQRYDVIALYKDNAGYPAWNLPGFIAFLVPVGLTIAAVVIGDSSWFYGFYENGWFTGSILGGLIYYFVAAKPAESSK